METLTANCQQGAREASASVKPHRTMVHAPRSVLDLSRHLEPTQPLRTRDCSLGKETDGRREWTSVHRAGAVTYSVTALPIRGDYRIVACAGLRCNVGRWQAGAGRRRFNLFEVSAQANRMFAETLDVAAAGCTCLPWRQRQNARAIVVDWPALGVPLPEKTPWGSAGTDATVRPVMLPDSVPIERAPGE